MEWLKKIIGEELYAKVLEELGDKKTLIVNDGNFLPREKFNDLNDQVKVLKTQLGERDTQLEDIKKKVKDNEELTATITQLQADNKKLTEESETKMKDQKFSFLLELKLRDEKVKNVKAVKALLATDKLKLNDDETFTGLDEQIKTLKESDSYLFGEDTLSGIENPKDTKGGKYNGPNPWSKDTLNLTKQGEILKTNPELAKVLQSQAKK